MRFASKRQLVDQIETEHDVFVSLVGSIPRSQRRRAGVWGDGWTIHDLLAHLMEWQLMFLRWYREGRDGGNPVLPAPGYKWSQTPELNHAIWRKHHRRATDTVLEELERCYQEIRSLVTDLSAEALLTPGYFRWTGKHPLTTYLAPNTSSHYRFARFYKRLGATLLTDWRICRLDEAQLSRVANSPVGSPNGNLTC